eukprot:gene25980-biopygen12520
MTLDSQRVVSLACLRNAPSGSSMRLAREHQTADRTESVPSVYLNSQLSVRSELSQASLTGLRNGSKKGFQRAPRWLQNNQVMGDSYLRGGEDG